ncbi:MAG: carboxylesterase/lipase family protein [Acidimicrobiales bacterium]
MPGHPVADTTSGRVKGERLDGVTRFTGIPYARPPTAGLRFQPPAEVEPWAGEREAVGFGPVARQNLSPLEARFGAGQAVQSEDCLTVNVWTPGLDGAARPVMVWIHGGAFVTGSSSIPWYDGTSFAVSGDVVLVSLNYRLGAFGFLDLGEVAGEAFPGSGLAGLLDQLAALRWVRDNVSAFGGDPSNVTVFGESAGAMSIGALLGMPGSAGLFRRAILQSGACSHTRSREDSARLTADFLSALGLEPRSPGAMKSLLEARPEALLGAQAKVAEAHRDGLAFLPVVDGIHLPRPPLEAVSAGRVADVDLLVGTNRDEMRLFVLGDERLAGLDEAHLVARAKRVFGPEAARRAVAGYRTGRPGARPSDIWTAMATDRVFRIPAIRLAEAQSQVQGRGRATYCYLFTWATSVFGGTLGSCHALEIPFVFDTLDRPGADMFTGRGPEQTEIARRMQAAWVAFARRADPDGPGPAGDGRGWGGAAGAGREAWRPYAVPRRSTMLIGSEWAMVDDPAGDERRLWDGVEV